MTEVERIGLLRDLIRKPEVVQVAKQLVRLAGQEVPKDGIPALFILQANTIVNNPVKREVFLETIDVCKKG